MTDPPADSDAVHASVAVNTKAPEPAALGRQLHDDELDDCRTTEHEDEGRPSLILRPPRRDPVAPGVEPVLAHRSRCFGGLAGRLGGAVGFGAVRDPSPPPPGSAPATTGSGVPPAGKVTFGGGGGAGAFGTAGVGTAGTVTVGRLTGGTVTGGGGSGGNSAPAEVTQPAISPPHVRTSRANRRRVSDFTS